MAETAVDFLLESLNQLTKGDIDCPFSLAEMNQMGCLYEEVEFLRTTLKDLENNRNEHGKVKDLLTEIMALAYEAADIIDLSLVDHISQKKRSLTEKIGHVLFPHRMLVDVLKEIKSIKKRVTEIHDKKLYSIGDPPVGQSFRGSSSRVGSASNVEEEIVVGFDQEVEMLKERLITGIQNQLEVVSIVGMAGSGKTTLARKLYNDPFILYHFYIRGWTSVSQVYRKRDLLLDILSWVVGQKKTEIHTLRDEQLGQELYKRLKCMRYLFIMDDMWDVVAWNDLKIYFPNDNNGSIILFTSRHTDVALQANCNALPHHVPFLKEDDSWDLLEKKIFRKESCPPELTDIGKQIASKCQGLPLAIVVVAGLLANADKNQDSWKQVAGSLSSYVVSDTRQCMNILGLSYNSLPHHLRLCFLYFSAFPEDYEISVRKLIWLWIAEGFIVRIGHESKSLEDVAQDYLMDLIDRNLVLVAKRKSTGGIRACRVHDLLHELCLNKAKEENFLQQIYEDREVPSSSPIANKQFLFHYRSQFFYPLRRLFLKKAEEDNSLQQNPWYSPPPPPPPSLVHIGKQYRRLCVNSHTFYYIPSKLFAPHIRSFLCFVSKQSSLPPNSNMSFICRALPPNSNMSFICRAFKLLRVLDLSAISISYIPYEIDQLYLLRYLAIQGKHLHDIWGIGNLCNLETLIVSQGMVGIIPYAIWSIVKLRHLRIAGENDFGEARIGDGYSFVLNLQTISQVQPSPSCQNVLARTPNLRKLGFCGRFDSGNGCFWFPDLDFLNPLETLKLLNRYVPDHHRYNLQGVKFPPNLKSLTLSNTALEWKEMSVLGMLPNLEVLKLEFQACIGSLWETSDGGFCRLKYLRLYYMNLEQWNASSIHFPSLQQLVLHRCRKLKEIPFELGDICTLQKIEVSCCSDSAVNSAWEIQKELEGIGNDSLKIIIINAPNWEFETYS